jgi:hypothetical protein
MNVQDTLESDVAPMKDRLPPGLPEDWQVHDIAFVAERSADQVIVLEFPDPIQCRAVRVRSAAEAPPDAPRQKVDLSILAIPTNDHQDEVLLRAARAWVERGGPAGPDQVQVMTLQGAQILWWGPRMAVMGQPERIDIIRTALIEVSYYLAELNTIERTLRDIWPQVDADMPLSFEFNQEAIGRRTQLLQRFQQVLKIRVRLVRIGPLVHGPHVHPATLASQIGERFRERTRMVHRHDALGEQLDVLEKVYETCGQRASDFMLSRSSNTLEWIIIILLVVQTLLVGFEYLVTMGQ